MTKTAPASMPPEEVQRRVEAAKDAIWGRSDDSGPLDLQEAIDHIKSIPGSEEAVGHLNAIIPNYETVAEDGDKALHHFSQVENSLDRLSENHGLVASESPEGPLSFLAHARQGISGWDPHVHQQYRNFLNDLEDHAVASGKSVDELMSEYMNDGATSNRPIDQLIQKHDNGDLRDAVFIDAENHLF